jgi:non-canonical purine NTP pyrophosphatase (RdgB/HAM1 family)
MNNPKAAPLLLIATNNKGKIKELQDLLKDTQIELITPAQINLDLDVAEDGHTYVENATKKALAFAQVSGLISLADDSGLEVDALGGAPGLYSARYGSDIALRRRETLGQKSPYVFATESPGQTPPMDSALPRHDRGCHPKR